MWLLLAAMGLTPAAPAEGAPVSWAFSGQVSFAEAPLAGVIDAGDLLDGVVVLESATPDALPLDANRGVFSDSVLNLAFTVGSYVGSGPGGSFGVFNDLTNAGPPILDALSLCTNPACGGALVGADVGPFSLEGFFISVNDFSGTALNDEVFPA